MTRLVTWARANPVVPLDVLKFLLAGGAALGWWVAPASAVTDVNSAGAALAFAVLTGLTHQLTKPPPAITA